MNPWWIVLIVVLVLFFVGIPTLIFLMSGYMTTKMLKKSDIKIRNMKNMDVSFYDRGPLKDMAAKGLEFMDTLDVKETTINSFDGFKLHAYLIKNPYQETNKYFLGMHGFKSGPRHEYAPYLKYYLDAGYNIVIPDERAHYKSEGDYITMGLKEKYDCLDWAKWIVKTYGKDIKILIQGISMGAATVCLASELDLPKQVVGIVSDCPYSSLKDELEFQMKRINKKVPVKIILGGINYFIKRKMHVSINDTQPIDAVKNAKVPMIFYHGAKDEMCDVEFSKKLYEACSSKKKLIITDEANHAESIAYQKENYIKNIEELFNI